MTPLYVTIDGVQKEITALPAMVDGVQTELSVLNATVDGAAREIFSASNIDPVFANNSWATIIAVCQSGDVPDTWAVGDQKPMTIDGADYQIDIIGRGHDEYSDGSGTAPLTFQMHDCYASTKKMNATATNALGWSGCSMRRSYLPDILALMPEEVQAGIREVNKKTSSGGQSTSITTTADKLFLLSEIEIFGSAKYSVSGEGSRYAYYSTSSNRVKNGNGSAVTWWERSPYKSDSAKFCYVGSSGSASYTGSNGAAASRSVAFAFCF